MCISMKNLILLLALTISYCQAQTLEKNEVDEFTGKKIKQTSYEILCQNFTLNMFISAKSINDSINFLRLKLIVGSGAAHSINEGDIFYLKLKDGKIVELKNSQYAISCTGCGARGFIASQAQGTETNWFLTEGNVIDLTSSGVSKIRIYTSKGYLESEVKESRTNTVASLLKLTH